MTEPVALLFGVHAHQPVGNFEAVLEDAHERCYRPFLRTLERYPAFRFALHVSGWLLEHLADRFPADVAALRAMVARGQVELFGGGDYEPVLAAIPARDRVGQLRALATRLERTLGAAPDGAWLTERVWEATVVPSLAEAGVRYVTVDDYHFLCAGERAGDLDGYFSTEEGGVRLDLFPISEGLRYRVPFAPAHEVVAYLESLAGRVHAAAIYFDDIEKFGIWPETHEWVYGRRWLEQFIEGVLASPRIVTRTYREHHARAPTRGVVYLPTTSYIEMNEWTLPAESADVFAAMTREARESGRYESHKPFIRGGIWRNFLSRYGEANWMHKRMVALSGKVAESGAGQAVIDHLYRAQANDAYWHGLFGGLYLPHLRRAVWQSIARAEAALAPPPGIERVDLDLDGCDELFLRSGELLAVLREDADGALTELTSYRLAHNFADTLKRYREHYFRRIEAGEQSRHQGEGIASAHDRVEFKHPIGAHDLAPDSRSRGLFVDRVERAGTGDAPIVYGRAHDAGTGAVALDGAGAGVRVGKRISVDAATVASTWTIEADAPTRFVTQINLAMPSCDGYGGRYAFGGGFPGGFGQDVTLADVATVALEDSALGGRVVVQAMPAAAFIGRPHHTVSQSEAGFEKIMQAASVELAWTLCAGRHTLRVELTIDPTAPKP